MKQIILILSFTFYLNTVFSQEHADSNTHSIGYIGSQYLQDYGIYYNHILNDQKLGFSISKSSNEHYLIGGVLKSRGYAVTADWNYLFSNNKNYTFFILGFTYRNVRSDSILFNSQIREYSYKSKSIENALNTGLGYNWQILNNFEISTSILLMLRHIDKIDYDFINIFYDITQGAKPINTNNIYKNAIELFPDLNIKIGFCF